MSDIIRFDNINEAQAMLGNNDEHLNYLEEFYGVELHTRGQELTIHGQADAISKAEVVIRSLLKIIQKVRILRYVMYSLLFRCLRKARFII